MYSSKLYRTLGFLGFLSKMGMNTGTVIKINKGSGYGFIRGDEDGREIFFHQRWLKLVKFRDIREGSRMVFDIHESQRGPRAVNLRFAPEDDNFSKNMTTGSRRKRRL
jgi:CspA family cold shock protein